MRGQHAAPRHVPAKPTAGSLKLWVSGTPLGYDAEAVPISTPPYRRTKIIATWGPALSDDQTLRSLVRAGVDVFRLNFSHATHKELTEAIPRIRRAAAEEHRALALMQDIQGPRIRTGPLSNGTPLSLKDGSSVIIQTNGHERAEATIPIPYSGLADDVAPGHRILIADGTIVLRVTAVSAPDVEATVVQGGLLGAYKGVNLPDSRVSVPTLTEKDREDLAFGTAHHVDYVALSFVRRREDILECRRYLHQLGSNCPIIAKIEHPEAITNLEEVLIASDGVMVARGDLGVELSPEQVPLLQKHLIHRSNDMGLPVITATQMLESMVDHTIPTRAEASDVANAVLDGTGALMLSAETAVGRHPVETVETMARIAIEAEQVNSIAFRYPSQDQSHALALAARELAKTLQARAIIVFTRRGSSAQVLSHLRPATPVYAFTDNPQTHQRLALWYGVTPLLTELSEDSSTMVDHGLQELRRLGLAQPGDDVVVVGAEPWETGAPTNFVTVRPVPHDSTSKGGGTAG